MKNVVGYDLTQLLVGSEGTLAIITEITLRLVPKPPARATLRASFSSIAAAADGVTAILHRRARAGGARARRRAPVSTRSRRGSARALAPDGTGALLLVEVDGGPAAVAEEIARSRRRAAAAGATESAARGGRGRAGRALAPAARAVAVAHAIAPLKLNHDVVVPPGRIPELFELVDRLRRERTLTDRLLRPRRRRQHPREHHGRPGGRRRARAGAGSGAALFEGVVALGGSISGEHGIGYTKARYLDIELTPATIALMRRVKRTFDPNGILNPGKIFPEPRGG